MPDRSLFSLPIPSLGESITYAQISAIDRSAADVLSDLNPGGYKFKEAAARCPWAACPTHLDPDLRASARPRDPGWRPLFGPGTSAQGHLDNNQVGTGDIFLFLGWFRQTEWIHHKLAYESSERYLHLIFGWLQVGDVWRVGTRGPVALPAYARYHPHAIKDHILERASNTIYGAATSPAGKSPFQWRGGAFARFDPRLQLTAHPSHKDWSQWRLPSWFYPFPNRPPLTYHENPDRWKLVDGYAYLNSVGKAQEFVLDADRYPEARAWVEEIISIPTA
jgi:hypothetical protein